MLDTIVAIATPPGVGALAVLRLSGPHAFDLIGQLADVPVDPPRTAHLRTLQSPEGETLDQVIVTLFPGPDSYTGEDVVEISTHGGRVAPHLVQSALERLGARPARAGEFTQRAWLNGKLDLVQAEAVADLVESSSRALHRVAMHQLDRGLSVRLSELREVIIDLEARLTHHIDFPEEDDAPVGVEELAAQAAELARSFEQLAATAPVGRLLREGARVVLAGRPNAGKSSLLNALVGEARAIVTEVEGTTRDRIEVGVEIEGLPFVLIDTAGLRETVDAIEREGVEVARAAVQGADLVLHCEPVGESNTEVHAGVRELAAGTPVLSVATKADLDSGAVTDRSAEEVIRVSAVDGRGLDDLRAAMVHCLFDQGSVRVLGGGSGASVLTRDRQVEGVRRAAHEMGDFARAIGSGIPPEVASAHLKSAATATEELLGTIGAEEVLDHVFSEFCIGK